jgi:hypothetical protein
MGSTLPKSTPPVLLEINKTTDIVCAPHTTGIKWSKADRSPQTHSPSLPHFCRYLYASFATVFLQTFFTAETASSVPNRITSSL